MTITQRPPGEAQQILGPLVAWTNPVYGEVMNFLFQEAALLDHDQQQEWLALVAKDIEYSMPVRQTLHRKDGPGIGFRGGNFHDDWASLEVRVRRNVVIESAYDRDPPPRTRRIIGNVLVYETDTDREYRVNSYIVLLRTQFDQPTYDLLSGERQDLLRKTDEGWRLARRTIIVDVTTLNSAYPNVLM